MTRVVIGMDPHKRSVTIEAMAPDESVLDGGRYATARATPRCSVRRSGGRSAAGARAGCGSRAGSSGQHGGLPARGSPPCLADQPRCRAMMRLPQLALPLPVPGMYCVASQIVPVPGTSWPAE